MALLELDLLMFLEQRKPPEPPEKFYAPRRPSRHPRPLRGGRSAGSYDLP
jgi:hypothetical protein